MQRARAARARRRLRLDRHVDAGKMLGQSADVAIAPLARLRSGLAPALVVLAVVVRWRWPGARRFGLAQPQRQLFGDDNGDLFRPRPEDDRPQFRDRRLQGLDFTLAGKHHLDQKIGVAGKISVAKRHEKY